MPRRKLPTCSASVAKPSPDKNKKNWRTTLNKSGLCKKSWASRNVQLKIRSSIRIFLNKAQPSVKTKSAQGWTPQARRHQQALLERTQPNKKNKTRSWCSDSATTSSTSRCWRTTPLSLKNTCGRNKRIPFSSASSSTHKPTRPKWSASSGTNPSLLLLKGWSFWT